MPTNDATTRPAALGLFVAVGEQGLRVVSADGVNWVHPQSGKEGEFYRAVCFGNGACVAVGTFGGSNLFASTRDGAGWKTDKKDGQYSRYVRGLGFGNGAFLALGGDPGSVGSSSPFVATSTDGVAWSDYQPISGKNILRRVAWGKTGGGEADKRPDGGLFVAVGDRGRRAVSADGLHWDDAPGARAIDTLIDVAFGRPGGAKPVFVGVGLHGLRMASADGLHWSDRMAGEEGEHLNSVVWAGDRFVAVGQGGTYVSPDGYHWERRDNHDAPLAVAWGGAGGKELFVGTKWKGRILTSPDGVEWKQAHQAEQHLEAIAWGEGG